MIRRFSIAIIYFTLLAGCGSGSSITDATVISTTEATGITPQYDYAESFSDGLALVRVDELYGYIDTKGVTVIARQYEYAFFFF